MSPASGDTLTSVAAAFEMTVTALRELNPDYARWPRYDPLPIGMNCWCWRCGPRHRCRAASPCWCLPTCPRRSCRLVSGS